VEITEFWRENSDLAIFSAGCSLTMRTMRPFFSSSIFFFQIVQCFRGNIRAIILLKLARPRGFEPLTF
jgi:hypothetical protein